MKRFYHSLLVLLIFLASSLNIVSAQTSLPSIKFVTPDEDVEVAGSYSMLSGYASPSFDPLKIKNQVSRFSETYEGDWDAMCSYAQNNIRFMPHFGIIKGSVGALQGGRGTSFDQSQLMVQAYRIAGGEARYKFGRVKIEGELVKDLTGIDPSSPGASMFIDEWFSAAGMPVEVHSVGGNPSVEILHVWTEGKVGTVWKTCDPSLQTLEIVAGIDLANASGFSGSGFMATALSGSSYGTDAQGIEWASSVNGTGIQSTLNTSAMVFKNAIDAQFGESIPAIEEVIGGEIQIYQDGVRGQSDIVVLQSKTWTGEIPLELKAKARIYGFADVDFTIYADEIADERLTLRWVSNDGFYGPFDGEGTEFPTNGFYELVSGHRSLREIEEGSGSYQVHRSSNVTINPPSNGIPLSGEESLYEVSIDIDMPYPDNGFDRKNGSEIKKWVTPAGQTEVILAFGGISQKEKLNYTIPAGQDGNRHDIKHTRAIGYESGQPLPYSLTIPDVSFSAKGRWIASGGPDLQSGGSGTVEYVSVPWDNYDFWQHGWDQRFDLLTDKDFIWRIWLADTGKLADILGRVSNSRIVQHYHVGVVTGSGGGNNPPIPIPSLGGGSLWIDAESVLGLAGASSGSYSPDAIKRTYAIFSSALEAGAIGELLTFDRVDWSDYADNDAVDTFHGFSGQTNVASAFKSVSQSPGGEKLIKLTPVNFDSTLLAEYEPLFVSQIETYLSGGGSSKSVILGVSGINPQGHLRQSGIVVATVNISSDVHLSFLQGGANDNYAFFRKGAGGTLTDIGGTDYVRSRTEGGGLAFGASISDAGEWSYSADADLTIGAGGFPYELSFQRSLSMNSYKTAPLAGGWSHNWDIHAEYSSSYGQLIRPGNPRALGLSIATIQAALEVNSSSMSPENLLVLSEAVSHWSEAAKQNSVMIPGAGVFVKLPDGSFVAPPVAGNEAATLTVSGDTLVYTSASREVLTFNKQRPSDFCYPDDEAGCTIDNDGYGLRAPDNIVRRYYATSWQFPSGVEIGFLYNPKTGTLAAVSNNLGRGFSFSYGADTACPYFAADPQNCSNKRRRYDKLQEVEDTSGRKIRFAPEGEIAFGYGAQSCLEVFHSETGFTDTSPRDRYCRPVKDSSTLTIDGPYGASDFVLFRAGDDQTPYLTVSFHDVYTGREYTRIDEITDAVGNTWNVQAGYGRKIAIAPTDDGGRSSQIFDQRGNLVRTVSPMGWVNRSFYDLRGRPIEEQIASVSDDPRFYRYRSTSTYDEFSNIVNSSLHTATPYSSGSDAFLSWAEIYPTDPQYEALETTFTYDVAGADRMVGNVLTTTNPLGATVNYTYKPNSGLLDTMSGPEGEFTQFFYNGYGQLTGETVHLNSFQTSSSQYTYNFDHYVASSIQSYGATNLTTAYDYDAVGNLISLTDPRNNTVTATYDLKRRMTSFSGAAGEQSVYEYDTLGRLRYLKQLRPLGNYDVIEIMYLDNDRPSKVIEPSGDFTTYSYNNANRLDLITDPDGLTKRLVYYPGGQIEQIIKAVGTPLEQVEARYWYAFDGSIERLRPARGNRDNADTYDTLYEKDAFGRTYQTIFADGSSEALTFNRDGTVASKSLRLSADDVTAGIERYLDFEYDLSGRQTLKVERLVDGGTTLQNQKNTCYDLAGRVTRQFESAPGTITGDCDVFPVSAGDEDIVFDYDVLSRLTSETANGRTVGYDYDPSGNRTKIIWPDAVEAVYSYDAANRLDTVSFAGVQLADYDYDIQSRLTDAALGNGTTLDIAYDADSLIDTLTHNLLSESGASETLSWDYGYRPSGRLASTELLDALHPEFVPDMAKTISYGSTSLPGEAANELDQYEEISDTETGTVSLGYDGRGNLVTHGGRAYTFDFDNRLTGFTETGSTVSYDYDVSGRRVGKIVNGLETRFLHAGDMEIAEYDDQGTLLRRYIPGGATDARVAWIEGSGTSLSAMQFYHADRLGNVAAMTDSDGEVSARYAYDPFGNEVTGAATSGNPFRYTGRLFDAESGLYYYRARYYAPVLGRFLQTDPIGYDDQMNLYAYVHNDPLNATDPSGMFSICDFLICLDWIDLGFNDAARQIVANRDAYIEQNFGDSSELLPNPNKNRDYAFGQLSLISGKAGAEWYLESYANATLNYAMFAVGEGAFARTASAVKGGAVPARTLSKICCFVAGTLVDTENGLRPIEEIEIGDLVWARDTETGLTELKPVTDLIRRHERVIWNVVVKGENSKTELFETTDDHPWWIIDENGEGDWLATEELEVGMVVIARRDDQPDQRLVIAEVSETERIDATYNLTVADFHTYFVGEQRVLVHNCLRIRGLVAGRDLSKLTHADVVKAFHGTGYTPTNHFISRVLDDRTRQIGVHTLKDVESIIRNGVSEVGKNGHTVYHRNGVGVVVSKDKALITIRPH